MKRIEKIKQSKSYAIGYEDGKRDMMYKLYKFIEEESKFTPDIHIDKLLDRLASFIKKI